MKVTEWACDRIKEAFEIGGKGWCKKAEHRPRNHDKKCRVLAAHHRANGRARRRYDVIIVPALQQCFAMEDYVWWVSGEKKHTNWWCAICGEKYDWKQSNMLLVVQTGESVNQANVFRAHAVLQGLCGNLINALKLLANQQEDGGGLTQNIVAKLCEGSRKGLTEGLR